MKMLLNDEKYVIGYCIVGDIEGSVECSTELPNDIDEKLRFYKFDNNQFILDVEKYNLFQTEQQEIKKQEEMLKKFEKEKLINSLGDTEAYSIRLLYDEWTVGTNYKQNYKVKYNNKLYRCLLDHTSQSDWTPDVAVSLWVEISNPDEKYPEWKQPTGAHDAYKNGDKVSYEENKYISIVDDNVWKPTEYGWKSVEEL